MTPIHYEQIVEPAAWRGSDLDKAALTRTVTESERKAAEAALSRLLDRAVDTLTQKDFENATLRSLAEAIVEEARTGRGVLVLNGFNGPGWSAEELTKIYWGLGTLMGVPATQSIFGDRLGHVRRDADNPTARGYRSDHELDFHGDTIDIAGLLCLNQARSGGITQIVSALAIHNEIAATRPELLPVLYEGFYWHLGGEQNPGDPDITRQRVPVFAMVDGKVCCRYLRPLLERAGRDMGGTPKEVTVALDYFDAVARRLMVEFLLEPGEMIFSNNFTVLHARTAFEDFTEPGRQRHLVRLWLEVPGLRPFPADMDLYGPGGIKSQPEKLRALQALAAKA